MILDKDPIFSICGELLSLPYEGLVNASFFVTDLRSLVINIF